MSAKLNVVCSALRSDASRINGTVYRNAGAHLRRAVRLVAMLALLAVGGLLISPAAHADFTWSCGTTCTWTTTFGLPGYPSPEASCAARPASSSHPELGWALGTGVAPFDLFWECYSATGSGGWGEISVQGTCPTAPPGGSLGGGPSVAGAVTDGHVALCDYFGPPPTCPGNQSCKPPKVLGPPPPGHCEDCTRNPIRLGTGNKFLVEKDYTSGGLGLLRFVRYYNSDLSVVSQHLGQHWSSTWDRAVFASSTQANVVRPDGKRFLFNKVAGVWTPDADVDAKLSAQTDTGGNLTGWTYQNPEDDTETYDKNGRLTAVTNRAGLTVHIAQDTNGRVHSVTDPFGRTLTFAYDSLSRLSTLTDPNAELITYAYDAKQNLSSVTYQDASVRTYVYENTGFPAAVTGIVDENGNRYSTYAYDAASRATSSGLAGGADQVTISYNANGTQTVTDALNTARTYTFQTVQGVVVTNAVSAPCDQCPGRTDQSQSFDANGNVASRTDFNGNRTNYTYDLTRNLETQRVEGLTSAGATTSVTRTITTEWDSTFRLPHRIAEPKRITTLAYDTQGNVTSKSMQATTDSTGSLGFSATTTGSPRTWAYTNTYSGSVPGLLIQQVVDGPRTDVSDVTTSVWDNSGNLTSVTNALGQVTTLGNYDAHGHPQQITDPNTLVTTLAYDLRGRLTSKNVGGETTSYFYDGVGQLTQVTLPDNSYLIYTYDAAHRLTQIRDNLNNKIVYTLDAMGNRTQEQVFDPANTLVQSRSRVFNSLNRLVQDIGGANPATEITQYGYDSQGNLSTITDPLSHLTTNAYDALNRLSKVIDPAASGPGQGGNTQYAYDGLDQITQVTDPRSLVAGYTVNGLGNLSTQVSPDTGTTTATYDAAGNTVTRTDARGAGATFTTDALNRQIQAAYSAVPGGLGYQSTRTYTYDQGSYGKGRLTGFSDTLYSSTVSYTYDQKGRITQENRYVPQYGQTDITAYSYDSFGRLSTMTYPSGRVVSYTRDALGRISQITTLAPGGSVQTVVSAVSYQPFGGTKSWTFGNGATYSRSFDLDGRISGYTVANLSRSVSYDAAGRITGYTHNNAVYNQSFGYDNLDRVTSWVMPNTNQAYSYDLSGNRTSITYGANTYTYTYPSTSNRLSSVSGPTPQSYQYDAAGNVTSDGARSYAFYASGAMGSATTSQDIFWYLPDALQQRVSAESIYNSDGTLFVRNKDGALIAENPLYWNTSAVTEYIYLNGTPVAVATGPTNLYFIYPDHLDTPRAIVNGANNIVWRWDSSDPFGSLPADSNPSGLGTFVFNLRFPGQYFNQETGLHYNYYRDYDPSTGRYVESDPVGLDGGINTYAYGGSAPLLLVDPLGLNPGDLFATRDDAAIDAGSWARTLTPQTGEYGGWIRRVGNCYTYDVIRDRHGKPQMAPRVSGREMDATKASGATGAWHTHPNPDLPNPNLEYFSGGEPSGKDPGDIEYAHHADVPVYVNTPTLVDKEYDPRTGRVRVLPKRKPRACTEACK